MTILYTPTRKQKRETNGSKGYFPPLPIPGRSRSYSRDDAKTVASTISPTPSAASTVEYSFETPSTKSNSPGRYAWSISTKKGDDDRQVFGFDRVPNGQFVPPSPLKRSSSPGWRYSPSRAASHHGREASRAVATPDRVPASPLRRSSPRSRFYSIDMDNHPNRVSPVRLLHTRSASPSTRVRRKAPVRTKKRNESILDLTDSEDEDGQESVVSDSALRQLIKVTSHTLSEEGRVLEEESFIELPHTDLDRELDGLHSELRHVKRNEERFHNEISFAVDKVAYGHPSARDLNKKFVSHQGEVLNISRLDNKHKNHDEYGSFMDRIIGMCVCCGPETVGNPNKQWK